MVQDWGRLAPGYMKSLIYFEGLNLCRQITGIYAMLMSCLHCSHILA